jgi:hypothetical protein
VIIQGLVERRLVVWPLDGSIAPQPVDDHVNLWPLLPDPTGEKVLYSAGKSVFVLNVRERRSVMVGMLPAQSKITQAQWSPDSRAVAYVTATEDEDTSYYASADGMRFAIPMKHVPNGLPLDVAWLDDGRPVTIFMGVGEVGGLEARYQVYDPATGEQYLLSSGMPTMQPWSPWRSPDGSQQVYVEASWDDTKAHNVCKTGPLMLTGADWVYVTAQGGSNDKLRQTVVELHNVYLDRPTWLHDGRILMRGMADEACAPSGSGLYVTRIGDAAPVQIVKAASPYAGSESDGTLWGLSYALSPDQSLIAWSDNDVAARLGSIRLIPVAGGESHIALQVSTPLDKSMPYAFQDQEMILYFIWLP